MSNKYRKKNSNMIKSYLFFGLVFYSNTINFLVHKNKKKKKKKQPAMAKKTMN